MQPSPRPPRRVKRRRRGGGGQSGRGPRALARLATAGPALLVASTLVINPSFFPRVAAAPSAHGAGSALAGTRMFGAARSSPADAPDDVAWDQRQGHPASSPSVSEPDPAIPYELPSSSRHGDPQSFDWRAAREGVGPSLPSHGGHETHNDSLRIDSGASGDSHVSSHDDAVGTDHGGTWYHEPGLDGISAHDTDDERRHADVLQPTPTFGSELRLQKRATLTSNARNITASSFASGLASTWMPEQRSVWFQKKAVIITSIFLAIFIVLIIGATVFLRDWKNEAMLDEEDLSDEAAVERMREERLRNSADRRKEEKRREKERKKRQHEQEKALRNGSRRAKRRGDGGAGGKGGDGGGAQATGIGFRWVRVPVGRLRHRKKDLVASVTDGASRRTSSETQGGVRTSGVLQTSSRDTMEGLQRRSSPSASGGTRDQSTSASGPGSTARSNSNLVDGTDSSQQLSSGTLAASVPATMDEPSVHGLTDYDTARREGAGARLDAADFTAVEEAERVQAAEADHLPPSYLSSRLLGPSDAHLAGVALANPARPLAGADDEDADLTRPPHRSVADEKRRAVPGEDPNADSHDSTPLASGSRPVDVQADAPSALAARPFAAHVATDDKVVLGALSSAASAPPVGAASAPSYEPRTPVLGGATVAAPSAPVLDVDQEGFERHDDMAGASADGGSAASQRGGSGASSSGGLAAPSGLLPGPPKLRTPTFSPFDMPYHLDVPSAPTASGSRSPGAPSAPSAPAPPATSSSAPSAPDLDAPHDEPPPADAGPSARALEKAREAAAELQLASSSPADLLAGGAASSAGAHVLPTYEREDNANAPPIEAFEALDETEEQGPSEGDGGSAGPSAPAPDIMTTDSTPSAPPGPSEE